MNDRFSFYRSYWDVIQILPESERWEFTQIVIKTGLGDPIPDNLPLHFRTALCQINASMRASEAKRQNGKKGGAPKGNSNAVKKQPKTTNIMKENITESKYSLSENINMQSDESLKGDSPPALEIDHVDILTSPLGKKIKKTVYNDGTFKSEVMTECET